MKNLGHNEIKEIIINALKIGQENSTTKKELCELTGLDERTVRIFLAEIQENDGIAICSFSSNKGYFYPETIDEANHCLMEKKKRAIRCFNGSKALTKFIEEQSQMKLGV
ncbi:MAG: hypothetical protein RSF68_11560 [Myroides sp.]